MKYWLCLIGVLMVGCAVQEAPLPPVPPVPADLYQRTWGWAPPTPIDESPAAPQAMPTQAAPRTQKPNEAVYHWEEGTEYDVPVQLGWPVDIQLEPGELLAVDVDGDRAEQGKTEKRWQKVVGTSGQEYEKSVQQQHLFWTCTHRGQKQGIMLATTRRMYYLALKCVDSSQVRVVRWEYPPGPAKPAPALPPRVLPDLAQAQRFQVGYHVTAPEGFEHLRPLWVGNDRGHIYLVFPPTMLAEYAPLVREVTARGPSLVNSRQPAGKAVIVVDGLSPRLELRYGEGDEAPVVVITRGELQAITCPGDAACPLW